MDQYVVGGAVRDVLMEMIPKDIDYVWVDATSDDLLHKGWTQVGNSFPVFVDDTGREHALARREKKVGVGYYGFDTDVVNVSLEDDLLRRDLTMNSLAVHADDWDTFVATRNHALVIDPFGGIKDIVAGILRHTSPAYSEDSVRVLRTARFAARYGFDVHPDTVILMEKVAPELNHVPQERIWAEFEKGLMEKFPWLMFELLGRCGAMDTVAIHPYAGADTWAMSQFTDDTPLDVRFVLSARGFKGTDYEICRIPTDLKRVSDAFNYEIADLITYTTLDATTRFSVLHAFRAITDDTKLFKCMAALRLYASAGGKYEVDAVESTIYLMEQDLARIRSIDAAAIAATCTNGLEIKQKLFEARVAAM